MMSLQRQAPVAIYEVYSSTSDCAATLLMRRRRRLLAGGHPWHPILKMAIALACGRSDLDGMPLGSVNQVHSYCGHSRRYRT